MWEEDCTITAAITFARFLGLGWAIPKHHTLSLIRWVQHPMLLEVETEAQGVKVTCELTKDRVWAHLSIELCVLGHTSVPGSHDQGA